MLRVVSCSSTTRGHFEKYSMRSIEANRHACKVSASTMMMTMVARAPIIISFPLQATAARAS